MSRPTARLSVLAAAGVFLAVGCGDDGSKYDRQYPAPQNEQNMMKVLRTHTTPARPRPRGTHERKESDMR